MKMKSSTYDKLKWVAQILLPAIGTLYFTVASLLGWPDTDIVVGIITAVDTFLGTILGISTMQYKKDQQLIEDSLNDGPDEDAR